MKNFLNLLGRELKGYFSFPLAYLILLLVLAATFLHLEPSVSPFGGGFAEPRGWLADFYHAPFFRSWGGLLFGLTSYLFVILPGFCLFWLVLARAYAEDALLPDERPSRTTPVGVMVAAELLGTILLLALLWAPAVGAAYAFKWMGAYRLDHFLIEVGLLALAGGMMRATWTRGFRTLLVREIKATFYSPIAYVVLSCVAFATGYDFFYGVQILNRNPVEATVVFAAFNTDFFWISFLLIIPLITMRTYSDEFRMGTIELVTTAPVRDWEIVAAKYGGALFFYCMLWVPSALYFIIFEIVTGKQAAMAAGAYGGGYLLIFLLGMFYLSIGCLCSSLTREQVNAAILSFVITFGFFAIGLIGTIMNVDSQNLRQIVGFFSAVLHMGEFSRGLIDSRTIVYYLSMTAFMLYLNFQVLQFRKWKS